MRRVPVLILFSVLIVAVSIAALSQDIHRAFAQSQSFTKSVEVDRGTYYRLKVQLTYKGEPQDFDIVVGCNVRQTDYLDNSRTVEVGLVPTVFGRRMSDGKGLVVRPPRACRGETTANGQVQPDLLPAIIVYDDAEILDFGTAYLSEDAYDGPLSLLKFRGASIEGATRTEFDEFRGTQPNLVKRESYWGTLAPDDALRKMNLPRVARPFGNRCEGYQRYRIPDELRPKVQQHRPEGEPNFWQVGDARAESELRTLISNNKLLRADRLDDPARRHTQFGPRPDDSADFGFPTRAGGGFVNACVRGQTTRFPAAYYPAANDYRVDQWPTDRQGRTAFLAAHDKLARVNIDFRKGDGRGFAYCFTTVRFPNDAESRAQALSKSIIGRIDGQEIVSTRGPFGPGSVPVIIFERDEFAFVFFRFYLESTRGDV